MANEYPIALPKPGALDVMGLPLHRVDVDGVHQFIDQTIRAKQKALVLNLNIHCVNLALQQQWLRDFIKKAQLIFCDGDGVRLGLKILGKNPPPKITYDRWVWQLAEFCAEHSYRLFLLGSRPGITAEAAFKLKKKYPNLQIAGVHHGYFKHEGSENDEIIRYINASRPDIVIVGFGMPVQEKWLSENWLKIQAHIFLTGGAVFDYASGAIKRAPAWMIKMHLEWLFRFLMEPKRLFKRYIFGNPYFFYRILRYKWANR